MKILIINNCYECSYYQKSRDDTYFCRKTYIDIPDMDGIHLSCPLKDYRPEDFQDEKEF